MAWFMFVCLWFIHHALDLWLDMLAQTVYGTSQMFGHTYS